jgi:hypothetical protein
MTFKRGFDYNTLFKRGFDYYTLSKRGFDHKGKFLQNEKQKEEGNLHDGYKSHDVYKVPCFFNNSEDATIKRY